MKSQRATMVPSLPPSRGKARSSRHSSPTLQPMPSMLMLPPRRCAKELLLCPVRGRALLTSAGLLRAYLQQTHRMH